MSSKNNSSSCLIDLSGDDSPTSNSTPMISFPPISAEEMIVQPLGRLSFSNNPFDAIEKQAKLFGDPFEITQFSPLNRKEVNTLVVPTGALIEVDGDKKVVKRGKWNSFNGLCSVSGNSMQLSPGNQYNNSESNAMSTTTTSSTTSSSLMDVNASDKMNQAFLQSDSSIHANNSTNRDRIQSDPIESKLSKSMRKMGSGKPRSTSLEQVCLKNQFRKRMSNSPIASPNWSKSNNLAVSSESSVFHEAISISRLNLSDLNRTSDSIFDDLSSTKPEWIDSDNEDSDFERMTIPFLKNIKEIESTVESITDCSDDRSVVIEKLSRYRKTIADSIAEIDDSTEILDKSSKALNDEPVAALDDEPTSACLNKPTTALDVTPQAKNITSIIETLREAVNNCGDGKKKDEASAMLDNLNLYLSNSGIKTSTVASNLEPQPIVRQRTFSVEVQLSSDDATKATSDQIVSRELSSSLPVVSSPAKRKSISGITPTTPRRFSRSMTFDGKPVSVVTAIPNPSNSRERRSSVCTTPTRLVRQTSNQTSTRISLNRQSMPSPSKDISSVVKTVQRRTIMKTSNPLSSNTAAKPLKLRVGEQTKPTGPLKAVIPYQRTTGVANSSDVLIKTKKPVQTSTPLGSNMLPKSDTSGKSLPAASSTPVITIDKPTTRSAQYNRSRLSYTPGAKPAIRHPASEKKKRAVTFCEETDTMSQSMIVGRSHLRDSTMPPIPPLQRRRLSHSYGTNKENSFLQKN